MPRQIALDDATAVQDIEDFAWTVDLTETLDFVDKYFSFDDVSFVLSAASNF